MLWLNILIFVIAVVVVTKSADWFLGSAEKIGIYFKLPNFVMGVILIGLGTSLPELATSVAAIMNGEAQIVTANILGSNIANILIIIGVATVVLGTIRFEKEIVDIDLPLLATTSVMFMLLVVDGELNWIDGLILFAGFIGYIVYSVFYRDNDENYHRGVTRLIRSILGTRSNSESFDANGKPRPVVYLTLAGSIALLAAGSQVSVDRLLAIVDQLGIGVGIVSFFALAVGTSLPELVVSIKALRQGKGDLVVGNIIGSCMFNILLIGSAASLISPQYLELPGGYWMVAGLGISVFLLIVGGITRRLHIWEGAGFLLVYVALASQIIR